MQSEELDAATYETIKGFCASGDRLAKADDYEAAISEYNRAWSLVPEPKNNWEASTWILGAIADAAYLGGYRTSAREALQYAMTCPGGLGNAFLHMRLGQVLLDSGEEEAAADELMRAYMGGGKDVFASEEDRYLSFLRTKADIDGPNPPRER